jgi:hypothetical protein
VQYSNNGYYRLYGNYTLAVNIQSSSSELLQVIINELRSISVTGSRDRDLIKEAIEKLSEIDVNASKRKQGERNIRKIVSAVKEILKLSFDSSGIRLRLDELLKLWEAKWHQMSDDVKGENSEREDDEEEKEKSGKDEDKENWKHENWKHKN